MSRLEQLVTSPPARDSGERSARRLAMAGALGALVLVGVLHRDTLAFLGGLWWSHQAYGHGLLLAPIGAYLLWARRKRIAALPWRPSATGLLFLSGVALASWFGAVSGFDLFSQMAVAASPIGIIWAIFGVAVLRAAYFPLACLWLAIPVWDVLISPLQDSTTVASTHMLRLLGVPVYVESNYMTIPYGQFSIARVCAGLRYLLAMVSIAALYGYLHLHGFRRVLLFVGIAVVTSVVFNWVRVTGIILAGHLSKMQSSLVQNHEFYGWILFVIALAPLLWIGARLAESSDRMTDAPSKTSPKEPGGAAGVVFAAVLAVLLVVSAAPAAARWLAGRAIEADTLELQPGPGIASWAGPLPPTDAWQPHYEGASAEYTSSYMRGADRVDVHVAYFASDRPGHELVSYTHADFRNAFWQRMRESERPGPDGQTAVADIAETLVAARKNGGSRLIWRWYVLVGRTTSSPEHAKLLGVWGRLTGRHGGAVVALSTDVTDSLDAARERLGAFVVDMAPDLLERIRQLGNR